MIPLENIQNGSKFAVTAAGAQDIIHQLPAFTPVIQSNATYPNDDHVFYPNGILPDGGRLPDAVATGKRLEAGMIITVDQLVYHCAKTSSDQKAYQCVHGTVTWLESNESKSLAGFFYLTYADVTRVEPYSAPAPAPSPVDTTVTIIGGSTTVAVSQVTNGQIVDLTTEVKQGVPTEQAPPPTPPPGVRIHVTQRTLYQSAATNTPNARISIRRPNGEVAASSITDANGFVEFPADLCIDSNFFHTETPAGFSGAFNATERELTLRLPDPYNQKTFLQLPIKAIFKQGGGSGDQKENADILEILRQTQPVRSFSIGINGRLLVKFEPPLVHRSNQPILHITEAPPPGGPGEAYLIAFGNQLSEDSTHVQAITQVPYKPTERTYPIFLLDDVPDGAQFEWIEISDTDNGGGVAGQPPEQQGVDLSCIHGYALKHSIVILLDVSGSMSVDDSWERSEANEARRMSERRVAPDSLYSNTFQSVLECLLPEAPAELLSTTFRLYAFYGIDQPPSAKHIELLGGPAQLSAFRAEAVLPEQIRNNYNDYTPLASAMKRAFDDLASDTAPCRTMIVITDGEGTAGSTAQEGTPSDEARPSEEISEAQQRVVHPGWVGVIELIGYKAYPPADVNRLIRFNAAGWSVAPHLVNNKAELDALFRLLRTKYALA